MVELHPYQLIIFDKDGTLLDFDHMWGTWAETVAQRLEAATGRPLAEAYFDALGYDAANHRTLPGQALAMLGMEGLRALTGEVLLAQGATPAESERALRAAWHVPDPAGLARPLADLPRLFGRLKAHGKRVAVATTDDRAPTQASLAHLGALHLVDVLACADDGLPLKPAPEMFLTVCERLGLPPAKAVMVGDSVPDMEMARAAGAGLAVGVLSGIGTVDRLGQVADVVVESVGALVEGE